MAKVILFIAIACVCIKTSFSQPGKRDRSFGTNGIVTSDLGETYPYFGSKGKKVFPGSDGSIYVAIYGDGVTFIAKTLSDGSADFNYGNKGFSSSVGIGGGFTYYDAGIQTDGKIVVAAGNTIVRFDTDGSLDSTFSEDGIQKTHSHITAVGREIVAVAIQNDGKIVVTGYQYDHSAGEYTNYFIVRYNTDGRIDNTFIAEAAVQIPTALAIQNNDKIILAAYYGDTSFISRLNTDGSHDSTFGFYGTYSSPGYAVSSLQMQSGNKIVVTGTIVNNHNYTRDLLVARYNADGSVDSTFDTDGKQTASFGETVSEFISIAIQNDDKIIVGANFGGANSCQLVLLRYNTNGNLDETFSGDGTVIASSADYSAGTSIFIQNNGKIVLISGNAFDRFNVDGSKDITFSAQGKLPNGYLKQGNTIFQCTRIQRDGKLIAAGWTWNGSNSDFVVARYNTDGSPDSTFGNNGSQITSFGSCDDLAYNLAVQEDGKIVVVGGSFKEYNADFALARYNADGTLDTTFSQDGRQISNFSGKSEESDDYGRSVAIQSDGKIVVAGGKDVARYNENGSLDTAFSKYGREAINFGAESVVIQSDGKIVVAGSTLDYYNADLAIARFNADGTPDNTFSGDGIQTTDLGFMEGAKAITLQTDRKIVVAGYTDSLSSFGNNRDVALVRYNPDGSIDSTFSPHVTERTDVDHLDNQAEAVVMQSDGKIVVGGFSSVARYNSDGTLDDRFGSNGKLFAGVSTGGSAIYDIAIADNKLYAVGYGKYPGSLGIVARWLLDDEGKNKAPAVILSIPYNIVKYNAPARIKLNATAYDEDGKIIKVQFYNNTTRLHTEDVFPYGYLWIDVPAGDYTLTAKAFDNSGNVTTSNSIAVSVVDENVPPVVRIVSPGNDTTYTGSATIRLIADAKDPNDKISKVEFYKGSTLLRTEYYYPYTYTWANVPPGTYILTAKAYDNKGISVVSPRLTVTVIKASIVNSKPSSSVTNRTDLNNASSLRLSPNPASKTLNIYTNSLEKNKQSTILVLSASGVVIKTIRSNALTKVVQVDVSSMASGVYTVKVVTGDKMLYKQFVKL